MSFMKNNYGELTYLKIISLFIILIDKEIQIFVG